MDIKKKGCVNMSVVGVNAKRIIKEQGRTQVYVAKKTGIKPTSLNNMLNGKQGISDAVILKLSTVLNVTPNDLFKPIATPEKAS